MLGSCTLISILFLRFVFILQMHFFFAFFLFLLSFLFVPFGLLLRVFVSFSFSFSPFISSQYLWLSLFLTIPFFFLFVCLFALSTRIAGIQIKQIEFFLSFFPHSMEGSCSVSFSAFSSLLAFYISLSFVSLNHMFYSKIELACHARIFATKTTNSHLYARMSEVAVTRIHVLISYFAI